MRNVRLLAAIFAPLVVVACAVGTAPDGSGVEGTGDDGGTTSADDSGYGTTGDSGPVTQGDSGSKTDGGTSKEGGTTPIDSGTGPVGAAGLDCSGKTSSSGESFDDECDDLYGEGDESDCSKGGGECSAGTCCRSSTECNGTFLGVPIGDFDSPQCVPM
jgi:hypothetical protein